MGARAQVQVIDTGVYLYTHWGAGGELISDVRKALAKRWRWGDPEYLARIVFNVMQQGDYEGETGFGIGTEEHGDIEQLISINCADKTVTIKEVYENKQHQFSFEDFVSDQTEGVTKEGPQE